jgi:hypothetical protein
MLLGSGYTVHGQGLASLAQGPGRAGPKRARVRADSWRPGPTRMGSRAKSSDLARPCLKAGASKCGNFDIFLVDVYVFIE